MNLRFWLRQQGLSVRELALQLEVSLKTVEDWVYRGVMPSSANGERLNDFMRLLDEPDCRHHWVIETPNGPVSRGVCKLCEEVREFENSINANKWIAGKGRARNVQTTE